MDDIRMKDERSDLTGSGYLIVEMNVNGTWTELTRTWFWRGKPSEVWVRSDDVEQVSISQHTDNRHTWTKNTFRNVEAFNGWFNMTTVKRKDSPLKKKGDC